MGINHLKYYKTRFSEDKRRSFVWKEIAKWISKRFIPQNSCVLDLAAGYCGFINNIKASERWAVDISPLCLQFADKNVKTVIDDALRFLYKSKKEYFDFVFVSNFFEHLERKKLDKVLKGILRVLKPSGRLIVIQPNFKYCFREYFDDYTHLSVFTDKSFNDYLESSGFIVEKILPKFIPFSLKTKLGFFYRFIGLYLILPFKPLAGQMFVVAKKS